MKLTSQFKNIILIFLLLAGCSKADSDVSNGKQIEKIELYGTLSHTQYWDYDDSWDLSSLSLKIEYIDGEIEYQPAVSKRTTYEFNPSSPVGLDHSISTFSVIQGTYKVDKSNVIKIPGREFTGIEIIDYPYSTEKKNNSYIPIIISVFLLVVLNVCIVVLYIKKKKK